MSSTSEWIYTAAGVREIDRIEIEEHGTPGYELMVRAGKALLVAASQKYPQARRWLILCGSGNNAGDGFVIARLAKERGLDVVVVAVSPVDKLQGDALLAWEDFRETGGSALNPSDAGDLGDYDLLVDALLGTGLARNLEGDYAEAVQAINEAARPVVAVDIPTGLHGDTGQVMGHAVRADLTVSFVGLKQGLFLGQGPDCCGELVFDDLAITLAAAKRVDPVMRSVGPATAQRVLPRRARSAHKGDSGHVLVVGGNTGMGGAVMLAAEAALRSGAGLVSVATRTEHVGPILVRRPELMVRPVAAAAELDDLFARCKVIAVGPGLGRDAWARELLAGILATDLPLVLDADALNLLAEQPVKRDNWVLTPHPGEAARLLGCGSAEVQSDRLGAVQALQARYGGAVILKGSGSLVADGGAVPWLIRAGNPGMAVAGMGDVLTGVVAALLAQYPAASRGELAATAAWAHAAAGDHAAELGERGLLAGDVVANLQAYLNP